MTVESIGKILGKDPMFDRCENCGIRHKCPDKKWCRRCIDRYYRQRELTPKQIEAKIISCVEPLYAEACLKDLSDDLRDKVLNRPGYQDVFIFGNPGVGKTHAIAAFIRYYIEIGFECKRINFDDFCCQVRAAMSPASKQTEWDMVKPLKEVDLLFIDDLGLRSKQETDFAYITLYSLLNKRQERLLPTFISTNKDLNRLRESFDERIVSRLQTALQIELKGEDRRKAKII